MTRPTGYNPDETHTDDGLPRERLRHVRWRTFGVEWAVAIVVVLIINFVAIAALERADPNRFRVQVSVKYDRLRDNGGSYDSLILGDSTPNQGVMPSMLDDKVGGKWINLATVANMLAMSDAWLLEEFIERHGAPERVLVVHVPDMWHRKADPGVMSQAPVAFNAFNELEPSPDFSLKDQVVVLGTRYFPLYSKHGSLLEMINKPWKLEDLRHAFADDGFMAVKGRVNGWEDAVKGAIVEHDKQPFEVSDDNARAVERLIALAEEHGFTIYLTPGSVSEPLAASPGYQRNFDAMMEQYREWAASSDRVTLILPEMQVFPDQMMFDQDHVNVRGAEAWTERLAEALVATQQGSADRE